VERKVILVHDILKLSQRCHTDLQRKLKASQRDNANARAYAVHSGSGLSSLASSSSHIAARPLVQRGPAAGGKRLATPANGSALRGSGGLLGQEPWDANTAKAHTEDEDEGRLGGALRPPEPRSKRPPAPHPIVGAQNSRMGAVAVVREAGGTQDGAAGGDHYYCGHVAPAGYIACMCASGCVGMYLCCM
jgi:hypothetical protein